MAFTLVTLRWFHGCTILFGPNPSYKGGCLTEYLDIDTDKVSYLELRDYIKELGYTTACSFYVSEEFNTAFEKVGTGEDLTSEAPTDEAAQNPNNPNENNFNPAGEPNFKGDQIEVDDDVLEEGESDKDTENTSASEHDELFEEGFEDYGNMCMKILGISVTKYAIQKKKDTKRITYVATCEKIVWEFGLVFENVDKFRKTVTKDAIQEKKQIEKLCRGKGHNKRGCPYTESSTSVGVAAAAASSAAVAGSSTTTASASVPHVGRGRGREKGSAPPTVAASLSCGSTSLFGRGRGRGSVHLQVHQGSANNAPKNGRNPTSSGPFKRPLIVGVGLMVADSGYIASNPGLSSQRVMDLGARTITSSAQVTGRIGYQPRRGVKWKGKISNLNETTTMSGNKIIQTRSKRDVVTKNAS
ncbi:hypothetical protein A4A49_22556 [Nicotiana attenuata]|uniref:PB1-like domain-containing protein n=1 Tax=Nicotiana attenuata TaxID=49451 RepID=A0A314LBW5_NICAT|nr:hypothetical protein A4A49_22556 [Nicotiana attenuata]